MPTWHVQPGVSGLLSRLAALLAQLDEAAQTLPPTLSASEAQTTRTALAEATSALDGAYTTLRQHITAA